MCFIVNQCHPSYSPSMRGIQTLFLFSIDNNRPTERPTNETRTDIEIIFFLSNNKLSFNFQLTHVLKHAKRFPLFPNKRRKKVENKNINKIISLCDVFGLTIELKLNLILRHKNYITIFKCLKCFSNI